MNKIKNNMRDVARVAASTYAFVALAIMSATTAVASLPWAMWNAPSPLKTDLRLSTSTAI